MDLVPGPSVPGYYGVSALTADDAWAVGPGGTAHWDGRAWSLVPDASAGMTLRGVTMLGPADVWAVGYDSTTPYSFSEHWDGHGWTAVSVPDPIGAQLHDLVGVAGTEADDVTAVGSYASAATGRSQGFAVHWRGSVWTLVRWTGEFGAMLSGVTALRGEGVTWAAGYYWPGPSGPDETLTERYMVDCSTPTATASPTGTLVAASATATPTAPSPAASATPTAVPPTPAASATATRTATPPTAPATRTPTATPPAAPATRTVGVPSATACPLQFADVPPGSPFYADIGCLACRGIISGYADGTYRPYANVTRGQLAKLVANAAGLADPIRRPARRSATCRRQSLLALRRARVRPRSAQRLRRRHLPPRRRGHAGAGGEAGRQAAEFTDAIPPGGRRSATCRPATRSGSSSSAPRCTE